MYIHILPKMSAIERDSGSIPRPLAWYSMSSADRYLAASTRCLIGSQGKLKHNNLGKLQ